MISTQLLENNLHSILHSNTTTDGLELTDPDTVPFETEKGNWTQEGCKGLYSIHRQMVLRPSAYVGL